MPGDISRLNPDVVTDDDVMQACREYVENVWGVPLEGGARTSVRMVLQALSRAGYKVVRVDA